MSETKTYVFPENGMSDTGVLGVLAPMLQNRGIDPSVLYALNNGGGFGNGGWFIWVFFLLALGWGGNGWGNNALGSQLNNDYGRDVLLQAINGNRGAVDSLASTLNCNVSQIMGAINAIQSSVQNVGSSVGLSGQQIINAIQSGNASLASQMASCCCEIRNAITTQGYENRLANTEQTAILGGKIDQQTNLINDRFCGLEMREMQNKIDALREENSSLKGVISNGQQTAAIQQYVSQTIAPVNAAIIGLQKDIDAFKCRLPETKVVPDAQGVYLSPCQATMLGLNGLGAYGFVNANNPIWG